MVKDTKEQELRKKDTEVSGKAFFLFPFALVFHYNLIHSHLMSHIKWMAVPPPTQEVS